MLKPREEPPREPNAVVISVRLSGMQQEHLAWLMTYLKMTRTEVIQALIEQEYEAQHASP